MSDPTPVPRSFAALRIRGYQAHFATYLLAMQGCAGVLWQGASQMLLYEIVPAQTLASAVRLNATARTLGVLVGPAVGGAIMLTLGPRYGLLLNAVFYLPAVFWLWRAPYGPRFRKAPAAPPRPVRGLADIVRTVVEVRSNRLLLGMILLAGCASFFVGNSYQAQMPGFAHDLGHGDPGVTYSLLLGADAAGALAAALLLESRSGLLATNARTAFVMAMLWCMSLAAFAATSSYPLAWACCSPPVSASWPSAASP